jgi:putative transposase
MTAIKPDLSSHSAPLLHVHVVFVVKYRRRALTSSTLTELEDLFRSTLTELNADLTEFNGEADHIHLLITYPPSLAVGELAKRLKGRSAHHPRSQHPHLCKSVHTSALWTAAYFASSAGGAPLDIIRRYIQQQERPQ